jgi:hypothetical protein
MKHPLIFLMLMIFIYTLACSFAAFFIEWMLTGKAISQLNWLGIAKIGGGIGSLIGVVIWSIYRFNMHQRR